MTKNIVGNVSKRTLALLLATVIVFLLFAQWPIKADAATSVTLNVSGLSVSYDKTNEGSVSAGANELTITAKTTGSSCSPTSSNVTVTLTNNSGSEANLNFNCLQSGTGSVKVGSTSNFEGASYSAILQNGESLSIVVSSGASNGDEKKLSITNISLTSASATFDVTVNYDSTMGSVKQNGNVVENGKVITGVTAKDGITLVAAANSGMKFHGWVDLSTGIVISADASFTFIPAQDTTVRAIFSDGVGSAKFGVASSAGQKSEGSDGFLGIGSTKQYYYTLNTVTAIFDDLNSALDYANKSSSEKYVVLMNSGTLPAGNYTIPSGVTLLISHNDANYYYGNDPYTAEMPTSGQATPSPFRILTLEDGANITVNGAIEVSARTYASHGGRDYGGRPVDKYGHIVMQGASKITLNSGSNLYVWGYISGSSNAQVIAESGSAIHEKMQVADYRGGSLTSEVTKDGHFPFNQYYVQNVEVKETVKSGANLICYAGIYATGIQEQTVSFMGAGTGNTLPMFALGNNSQATKYYDAATDRLIVDVYGEFSFNSITLMDENTADFVLPMQQNITINLKSGAVAKMNQDIMMQPGCVMNVDDGAKLIISSGKSAYLMDASDWGNFASASPRPLVQVTYIPTGNGLPVARTVSADAKLNINGTLVIEGSIYASAGHASIVSSANTGKIQFVAGVKESATINMCSSPADGTVQWSKISMSAVVLTNGNSNHPTTTTTGAVANTTFSYNTTCNMWVTHGAEGHGYEEVQVSPTCSITGLITRTCSACSHVETEVLPIVEHDFSGTAKNNEDGTHSFACKFDCGNYGNQHTHEYVDTVIPPTCTEEGYTLHACSVCADTYKSDKVDAHGHTNGTAGIENNVAPTCTEKGSYDTVVYCAVCGEELSRVTTTVDAHGHTEVIDGAVAPTCTEKGFTAGKHCSECNEVLITQTEIEPLGHIPGESATCTTEQICTRENCGVTLVPALDHNYIFVYNDEIHWQVCDRTDCGHIKEDSEEEHSDFEYSSIGDNQHSKKCKDCSYTVTEDHVMQHKSVSGNNHETTCIYCSYSKIEAHNFVDGACTVCADTVKVTVSGSNGEGASEKEFAKIEDAINNATEGDVINTKADVTVDTMLNVGSGVTLNAGDFTIDAPITVGGSIIGGSFTQNVTMTAGSSITGGNYTTIEMGEGSSLLGIFGSVKAEEIVIGEVKLSLNNIDAEDITISINHVAESQKIVVTYSMIQTLANDDENVSTIVIGEGYCAFLNNDYTGYIGEGEEITSDVYILAHTHDFTYESNGADTHTERCTTCDYSAAFEHNHTFDAAKAPTCTESGLTAGSHCSICNEVFVAQTEVDPLGHDCIEHEGRAPTCTEIGWDVYETCSRCNYSTYVEIEAHGHTEVIDEAVAPTCTLTGLTEGKHCSACNEVFVAQTEIEANGHNFENGSCTVCAARLGDISGEGEISIADVAHLNAYIVGRVELENEALFVADINGDGKITVADVARLNAYVKGKIELY